MKNAYSFYYVAKFPDISVERGIHQQLLGFRADLRNRQTGVLKIIAHETGKDEKYILFALAKRRQEDTQYIQSIEEILSEISLGNQLF